MTEGTARNVDMDFVRDLVGLARDSLVADGAQVSSLTAELDILYAWIYADLRVPSARKRRIHKAKEFREPSTKELKEGLDLVERKICAGQSVRPHLSRKVVDLKDHDCLLLDWGVHHLHLGTRMKEPEVIQRTKALVFCIFHPEDAYFVQLASHEFEDTELLEIVNANWPHLLLPHRLPLSSARNANGNVKATTRSEVKQWRSVKAFPGGGPRLMTPITLRDGTMLVPPGGGFASSGHSARVAMRMTEWRAIILQWEKITRGEMEVLIESARQRGIEIPSRITFKLMRTETGQWCAETPELAARLILPTN